MDLGLLYTALLGHLSDSLPRDRELKRLPIHDILRIRVLGSRNTDTFKSFFKIKSHKEVTKK
jgi:hypothetical protein